MINLNQSKNNTIILLNDLLQLKNLENVKIRFNKDNGDGYDPIRFYKEDRDKLLKGQFWNYNKHKSFREGNIAIGLARIEGDKWLLFNISKITKDLHKLNNVGYEYETLLKYEKYFGRLIIQYHNKSQNLIRLAKNLIDDLEVIEILPEQFNDDDFPGYENVNLSWYDLQRVIRKKDWKSALENQKGVYLIADATTGKLYVGSAYGENMILGRWKSYIDNGHGGNIELKKIVKEKGFKYIKNNFKYSILDIYKSKTEDKIIINRESRWKEVLLSRKFGYNLN
ncbi:MAG: GIY-YIG nuclease family protein [Patescibacteria group bacterium]